MKIWKEGHMELEVEKVDDCEWEAKLPTIDPGKQYVRALIIAETSGSSSSEFVYKIRLFDHAENLTSGGCLDPVYGESADDYWIRALRVCWMRLNVVRHAIHDSLKPLCDAADRWMGQQ